jgi:hypothetical protein
VRVIKDGFHHIVPNTANEMLEKNEMIELTGGEAILIIKEVEYLLISLNKIAEYYYNDERTISTEQTGIDYALETTRFIDQSQITRRLAKIRRIVSEKFDDTLGSDDMDDTERELEIMKYWERPGDFLGMARRYI